MVAGAITLVLINQCALDCRVGIAGAIAIFCASLLVLLGGFVTAASAVLRLDHQTYFIVIGTVLSVAAVGLMWFALTFDPLF